MNLLNFEQCTENEIAKIADLAFVIWNEYYPAIIGQQQVNYMLHKFYSSESIKDQMLEGQIFYIVLNDNKEVGFFSYSLKHDNSAFLHKLYILSEYRGKGAAQQILEFIELQLKKHSVKMYRLTVNRQNARAINFYFKSGFKIEQVADFDIGNNYFMNDFVMIKQIG